MDSVTLLPGAHISQTEDRAGMCASPQWSGLPAGTHCHAPLQPCWSPPSELRRAGGPPSHCSWFWLFHQEEGDTERGAQGRQSVPILVCVVSVSSELPQRSQNCACGEIENSLLAPLVPSYLSCCPLGVGGHHQVLHLDLGVRRDLVLASPLTSPQSLSHAFAFTALVAVRHFKTYLLSVFPTWL